MQQSVQNKSYVCRANDHNPVAQHTETLLDSLRRCFASLASFKAQGRDTHRFRVQTIA
jgi:hypothetical protein